MGITVKLQKGYEIPLSVIKWLIRILASKASSGLSEAIIGDVNTQGKGEAPAGHTEASRKDKERHYKAADYPHGTKPPEKLPKLPPPPRKGPKPDRNPNSSND